MRIAAALLGLSLMTSLMTPACAQGARYRVVVEAPRELAATLRQGLGLMRWQNDAQMGLEQLRRLAAEAVREAREAAATEGYFSAKVDMSLDEAQAPWVVTLKVEPGPRTRVAEIDIRFSGPALQDGEARKRFERVREGWRLRRGEPFRQADWEAAKRDAAREMAGWRYAAARVADSRAEIDPETRSARLMVEIASGPAFRFGPVRVTGLKRYPDAVAENLSPVRAGDTYERDKVLLYQRRLLETGYFASVQAELDTHPLLADAAPLRVAVLEASSQRVETGVSYTTDAGPRLELTYTNQDVFDSAWRFRNTLRVDQKTQLLQLDFDSPPRPEATWNNYFTRAKQDDIQNETTREFAFGVAHNFGPGLAPRAWLASAHFEEQRIGGDLTDNRHALYLGYRHGFRETDELVLPRLGYLGMVEVGGAPAALATQQFVRAVGSLSALLPLGRRSDLLLRGQVGAVAADSRQGIPSTFLFRTGGDQTVRGYAYESLGVRQGDAIVGGRRLALASVETTFWVGDTWGVATFVDAGNAWDSGTRFNAAFGYGVGVRFRTPIGPIRGDLAYGEETGEFRIHFSVGYTF